MRLIHEIALDILSAWPRPSPYARPYLRAMLCLGTIRDAYGADDAESIISYFLANSQTFRGPDARRLKAELKEMLR